MAEPDSVERKHKREYGVRACLEPLATFGQGEGSQAEGGKRGTSSADIDREERAAGSGREHATF